MEDRSPDSTSGTDSITIRRSFHPPAAPAPRAESDAEQKHRLSRPTTPAHRTPPSDVEDWWFCSTAIPLIAATTGPLANVLSIAALVTYWRMQLDVGDDGAMVPELQGIPFQDPLWCYDINAASLALGFVGNFFLLANFTSRIRYIVALPVTIVLWFLASGMLIGILVAMNTYVPPLRPEQTYTQGFWYGLFAAILYLTSCVLLMLNMLGYFLGHYGQHFNLTDSQRTLILQTMMFFIWLAGGAGVFQAVETSHGESGWAFVDALYFCDVTILTVGFGDLVPMNSVGRGLVFPYSVGGIISLGLVIGSLSRFAGELSQTNIIRKHVETRRARTFDRSMTQEREGAAAGSVVHGKRLTRSTVSRPFNLRRSSPAVLDDRGTAGVPPHLKKRPIATALKKTGTLVFSPVSSPRSRRPKMAILRQERDRFNAMRQIQDDAKALKKWFTMAMAMGMFAILWCVGAAVFFVTEADTQQLSYFDALYLCYVSLLTIGYGDLAPKSNVGRPFFVVWSLLAVPSMTILVSTLSDTVIMSFKTGTSNLADFTVLPKHGAWAGFVEQLRIVQLYSARQDRRAAERRVEAGFPAGIPTMPDEHKPTLEELANEQLPTSPRQLAKELGRAIKKTALDIQKRTKRYSYEEWVEVTELIRLSTQRRGTAAQDEEEEGLMEWDWIGENSPMMMHDQTEPEFVLERLCESLGRCLRGLERSDAEAGDGDG